MSICAPGGLIPGNKVSQNAKSLPWKKRNKRATKFVDSQADDNGAASMSVSS